MLDNINAQIKRNEVYSKLNFYHFQRPAEATQLTGDFFPIMMDYYHELNPAFIYNLAPENIDMMPAMTVRDGAIVLGAYVLKHFQQIPSLQTHFYISKSLAHLIPGNLKSHFSCWHIQQKKKIRPQEAKSIFIHGVISDLSVDLNEVKNKLMILTETHPDCKIELFLPIRRSLFNQSWMDSNLSHELIELIKSFFPQKKLQFLNLREILDRTSWRNIYTIDLLEDSLVISDNFLNHFIAARGGCVSSFSETPDENMFFELDLSLHHKIQFSPLPEVKNIFAELIFYKKQMQAKDPITDPNFHLLIKKKNFNLLP